MKPETAMRQAGLTSIEYFAQCFEYLDKAHPNVSEEVKMQCASRMALAASLDYATAAFTGAIDGHPAINKSD